MANLGTIGASGFIVYGANTQNSSPSNGYHSNGSISFTGTTGSLSNTSNIWYMGKDTGNAKSIILIGAIFGTGGEKSFTFVS